MNSIDEKSIIQTLNNYLVEYKNIFYKRGFENFVVLIISILYIQKAPFLVIFIILILPRISAF